MIIGLTCSLFASVAGVVLCAVGKLSYCQHAFVFTAAASHVGRSGFERIQFFCLRHSRDMILLPVCHRIEGAAVGSHDSCYVRSYDFPAQNFFYGSEHRFIIESSALNHDFFSGFVRVAQLYHFVEGVLYDGIGKSGGYIAYIRPLFLRLLDHRVHEHRAAGSQVHRILGLNAYLGEVLHLHIHRFGVSLYERAAA